MGYSNLVFMGYSNLVFNEPSGFMKEIPSWLTKPTTAASRLRESLGIGGAPVYQNSAILIEFRITGIQLRRAAPLMAVWRWQG
jgi:hypothetical protein